MLGFLCPVRSLGVALGGCTFMWMLANQTSTLNLPFGDYAVPAACGIVAAGAAVFLFKLFSPSSPAPTLRRGSDEKEFDPYIMGSPEEKRQTYRRGGTQIEVYFSTADKKVKGPTGWVFDRSSGGLGLVLPEEFKSGTKLFVLPIGAPEMTPWVEVEVRSSRRISEGFETGCKFPRTPPWTVLLMFG